jgi:hypothetical protein
LNAITSLPQPLLPLLSSLLLLLLLLPPPPPPLLLLCPPIEQRWSSWLCPR